jgi:iron complex transport system substrate-binding protein
VLITKANRLFKALVYFYFISLCGACLSPKERAGTFLCITDSYQREIKLDKAPQKIISLSPGITEMLFLFNAQEKLVGISDYCNYPEATEQIKKIGGLQNINIETMISLHPDIVMIGSIIQKREVKKLEKAGVTVIAIKQEEKLEGIFEALKIIGQIVDNEQRADSLAQYYGSQLEKFKVQSSMFKEQRKPTVYYVVSFGAGGDFTAPKKSHIHQIIEYAGGRNIGEKLVTWNISREYLFEQNPDIIFIRTEELTFFVKTYPYYLLDAVKENRVYPIESGWIDVVSPRNFLAIELMKGKIMMSDRWQVAGDR